MSISVKELANLFVESGRFDKKTAEKKVKEAIAAVRKALPDSDDDTIEKMVRRKIVKAVSVPPSDKFVGVCIGYSEKMDQNKFLKEQALEVYEKDPMRAVQDGFVKVSGKKVIPLDFRVYIDRAETMENRMYGKPLKERMQREVLLVLEEDDRIVRAYGNVDPEVGRRYEVYGKMSGAGNITLARGNALRPIGTVDDLWSYVYDVACESEFAIGIDEIDEMPKGKQVVVSGVVRYAGETATGAMLVVGNDESEASVAAFAFAGDLADSMLLCEVETEVMVFGRVIEQEDRDNPGEIRKSISANGLVVNEDSLKAVDALRDIDDLFMEE